MVSMFWWKGNYCAFIKQVPVTPYRDVNRLDNDRLLDHFREQWCFLTQGRRGSNYATVVPPQEGQSIAFLPLYLNPPLGSLNGAVELFDPSLLQSSTVCVQWTGLSVCYSMVLCFTLCPVAFPAVLICSFYRTERPGRGGFYTEEAKTLVTELLPQFILPLWYYGLKYLFAINQIY